VLGRRQWTLAGVRQPRGWDAQEVGDGLDRTGAGRAAGLCQEAVDGGLPEGGSAAEPHGVVAHHGQGHEDACGGVQRASVGGAAGGKKILPSVIS
jgi:hypothetical protein